MENTTNTTNTQTFPRFLVAGKECIYRLFDAFLKKVVIDDYVIDFSKPATIAEDGSIEFASGDRRFSEIIGAVKVKVGGAGGALPMRGRNEPDYDYAKRVAKWRKAQKREQGQQNAVDSATLARDAAAVDKYITALENYLSGKGAEVSEDGSVDVMEIVEGSVMKVSKDVMDDMNLAAAHLNWLWSLGMGMVDTSCGDFSDKMGIEERWSENRVGYNVKDGLWQGRVYVKGDRQAAYTALKDLVSKFVAAGADEKKTSNEWKGVLKSVFLGQDYAGSRDCVILKEYFADAEKPKKAAKQGDAQESDEAKKPRKETLVPASKVAEKFEKSIATYIEKKGYKDDLAKFRKKDIMLLNDIFYRFLTWPNKPEFKTVEEVKAVFIEYIFKTKKNCEALVRNGLLHFCNPDKYINMYSYEKKVAYVQSHSDLLEGYVVSDYSELKRQDNLFVTMKFKKELDCAPYQANRTEEKICYIYDKLCSRTAG